MYSTGFSSSHIRMWELNHKEGWAPKNWCFWTVVLEKTLESPLDCQEIKPVNPKGNQPRIFIGRTDAKAPILWPPDVKSQLIAKDPDAGKDRRQEEKGTTGQAGWMASLTQWTWVWASSGRWWRTGKPGVPQSMGSQTVRHDWATEQQIAQGCACKVTSAVSDSSWFCGLQFTRLLYPLDSPGKNTGLGCHALLQGSSRARDQAQASVSPALAGGFFTASAIWEAHSTGNSTQYSVMTYMGKESEKESICV